MKIYPTIIRKHLRDYKIGDKIIIARDIIENTYLNPTILLNKGSVETIMDINPNSFFGNKIGFILKSHPDYTLSEYYFETL